MTNVLIWLNVGCWFLYMIAAGFLSGIMNYSPKALRLFKEYICEDIELFWALNSAGFVIFGLVLSAVAAMESGIVFLIYPIIFFGIVVFLILKKAAQFLAEKFEENA